MALDQARKRNYEIVGLDEELYSTYITALHLQIIIQKSNARPLIHSTASLDNRTKCEFPTGG